MLSELCVRRPVSATMLVMSLVVLGTFSFRGLGVDLFPKADPATVSVALLLPGASPDEMSSSVVEPMEEAISGVSGIDEIQSRIAEGRGQSRFASCSSATSTTPPTTCARRWPARSATCRRSCCRRSSPRSIPTPTR